MNKFELVFEKSTTRLAGFPYGEKVYKDQVKDKINFDQPVTIVFPKRIERVASSFTQGFFAAFVEKIGYQGIEEKVTIVAGTEELEKNIRENIY